MFPSSLDALVSDLHNVQRSTKAPLHDLFPTTYNFCTQAGYTYDQFTTIVSSKLKIPFRLCDSVPHMKSITQIPSRPSFTDTLSNTNEQISEKDYAQFCALWKLTKVSNLLELVWQYNQLDTTLLADTVTYLWEQIWHLTNLSAAHFPTIASLSSASFLYNCRSPTDKTKRIFLQFPSKQCDDAFSAALTGGIFSLSLSLSLFLSFFLPLSLSFFLSLSLSLFLLFFYIFFSFSLFIGLYS